MAYVFPFPDFYKGVSGISEITQLSGIAPPLKVIETKLGLANTNAQPILGIIDDETLGMNSSQYIPTQRAVKEYVDENAPLDNLRFVYPLDRANDDISLVNDNADDIEVVTTDITLATNSTIRVPTESAVVGYVAPIKNLIIGNAKLDVDEVTPALSCDINLIEKWRTTADTFTFSPTTQVKIENTTASTSSTTGALTVSGGVGLNGSVNANGNITCGGSITSSSIAPSIRMVEQPGGSTYSEEWNTSSLSQVIDSYTVSVQDSSLKVQYTPEVVASTVSPQFRVAYSPTNYMGVVISNDGKATLATTGGLISVDTGTKLSIPNSTPGTDVDGAISIVGGIKTQSSCYFGGSTITNGTATIRSALLTAPVLNMTNTNGTGIPNNTVDKRLDPTGKVSTTYEGSITTKEETKTYFRLNVQLQVSNILMYNGANQTIMSLDTSNDIRVSPPRWNAMPGFSALRDNTGSSAEYNEIGTTPFFAWGFGPTTNYLNGNTVVPTDIADSTPIIPRFNICTDAASTLDTYWELKISYRRPGSAGIILAELTQYSIVTFNNIPYANMSGVFTGLANGNYPPGTAIEWRIGRIGGNPLDTYGGNAWLTGFHFGYLADRILGLATYP